MKKTIFQGQWLRVIEETYTDRNGETKVWESVARLNQNTACVIVAKFQQTEHYVLLRQYRYPVSAYVLECPAGLIDEGECPEEAALRELKEETGYIGKVVSVSPPLLSSPGCLSESFYLVEISIDENLPENQNPQPHLEPEERIEVFVHDQTSMIEWVKQHVQQGDVLDSKLWLLFPELQNAFKKKIN